jgi:hypothetical protein
MRKEVEIGGKWYWELEATDQNQAFNPPEPAYVWDKNPEIGVVELCFVKKKGEGSYPFITKNCNYYEHCALLSSEHEKKSRRCTNFELVRWCAKGNGFWIDECGITRTKCDAPYADRNDPSGKGLVSICTWDGEPMEPTAKNMGLEE